MLKKLIAVALLMLGAAVNSQAQSSLQMHSNNIYLILEEIDDAENNVVRNVQSGCRPEDDISPFMALQRTQLDAKIFKVKHERNISRRNLGRSQA